MKVKKLNNSFYLLQLDKNDDVLVSIKNLTVNYGIKSAMIHGIGAIENLTVGYYDTETRKYLKRSFDGSFEICTLSGNITYLDSMEPIIHLHGVFSDRDYHTVGGHLFGGNISAAGEFFIRIFEEKVLRKNTGEDLKPMDL
ncbi:DNA-binding protein [bacterium]|nr:DNA-binding protein [bacterium]